MKKPSLTTPLECYNTREYRDRTLSNTSGKKTIELENTLQTEIDELTQLKNSGVALNTEQKDKMRIMKHNIVYARRRIKYLDSLKSKGASKLPKTKIPHYFKKGTTEYQPEQIWPLVMEYLNETEDSRRKDPMNPMLPTRTNFARWLRKKGVFITRMTFNNYEQEKNPKHHEWRQIFAFIDQEQAGTLEDRAIGGLAGNTATQTLMLKNVGDYQDKLINVNVDSTTFELKSNKIEVDDDLEME